MNALLEEAKGAIPSLGGGDESEDEGESWEGIQDDPMPIDHEEEYIDEDRYTTVTVEEVDVTKDGMSKILNESEDEDAKGKEEVKEAESSTEKGKKTWPKKPKKKKFRYETKPERKLARAKQKSGNKAKASARRGD